MITLQHLLIVEALAEEGSLTKAGERLYLTQSNLSHQIRDLEDKLGIALFERKNRKLNPTAAGARLIAGAGQILPLWRQLSDDLAYIAQGRLQTIRVSTECYTCYHWLPTLLKQYRDVCGTTEIKIIGESTRSPFESLRQNLIDVGIVSEKTESGLHYAPLFQDELVFVASREHPLAAKRMLDAAEVLHEKWLIYEMDDKDSTLLNTYRDLGLPRPASISKFPLTEVIIALISAEMGVGLMPNWVLEPHLENKPLVAIPIREISTPRTWYAACLPNRKAALEEFLTFLQRSFD
jgi:LysR family transcriptional regulator, regulator for metE and metH